MNAVFAKNKQLVFVGAGVLVALLLFVVLGLMPQLSKIGELSQRQSDEEAKLEQAKLTLKRLQSVRAEAAATEADLIKLARQVPADSEVPSLVVELQQMADASGLEFSSVGLGQSEEKEGFANIPVKMSAKGNFYAVVDFMYRVEKMPRKLVVTKFELINADAYPTLELAVELSAFKSIDTPAPTVPGAAPAPPTAAPAAAATPAAGTPATQ